MPATTPPPAAQPVDWEGVERDYSANLLSLREIGKRYGVSEGAIRKRAKRDGWTRDLAIRIQSKADDLVRKDAVRSEVRSQNAVSERDIVNANAEAVSQIRLGHRSDISRARRLVGSFLSELEQTTDGGDMLEQLGLLMRREDKNGVDKLNDLYHKVIGLSGRVTNLKALSETLKNLVALERQAWGLDEPVKPPDDPSVLSDDELDAKISARIAAAGTGAAVQVH